MTPQAGGLLARAVSKAGGFGMVGIEEIDTKAEIAEQLAIVQDAPAVPFGIGLVAWVSISAGATRHRYCRSPVPDLHLVRRPSTACGSAARLRASWSPRRSRAAHG